MTLARAIADLYAAFADLPVPTHIRHESYELESGEVWQLLNVPLRELSSELMRSYLFDAVYNVGTWDDFWYDLLELLPTEEIELDAVVWRLQDAHTQNFLLSDAQRAALHAFALAYWEDLLRGWSWFADMVLNWNTLEPFGVTRSEVLALWRAHPQGALALASVLLLNGSVPSEWPRAEAVDWLEEACLAATDEDEAQALSDAALMLRG